MSEAVPAVSRLLDLSGRVAIVTGSSGGIGAGIARRFAEAGASVVCHYRRNGKAAEAVSKAIKAAGGKALPCQADVAHAADVAALFAAACEAFGGVDILVNNAAQQPVEMLADMRQESWDAMMAANVGGPFLLTQAFAAHVRQSGKAGGAAVNIASIEARHPGMGHGHYATSKAALLMFTMAAAREFGSLGIRVNAVSPGLVHRHGIEAAWPEGVGLWQAAAPLSRLGRPDDVADAALFLASDAARWITGADLVVDGGMSTRPGW